MHSNNSFSQKTIESKELIVKFKKEHRPRNLKCANTTTLCLAPFEALNKTKVSVKTKEVVPQFLENTFVIQIDSDENLNDIIAEYESSGLFEYVENNVIHDPLASEPSITTPSELTYSQQWAFHNTGTMKYVYSKNDADIDMEYAWTVEQGNAGITVAIMDTGIDYEHPDLVNRMWSNTSEIPGNGIDDDNNGYIDDLIGYDFAELDKNPDDFNGHGTFVAGIIGAEANNKTGYAGVDWNCKLMALKVIKDNMSANYSDYVSAIYYAVANGARVINISLTSYNPSTALEEAFQYAHSQGVVLVAAMGNNGNSTVHYMAKSIYSIAVGATTPADRRASFSCHNDYIDVVAPGSYIYGLNMFDYTDTNFFMNGTSQAAPFVSGLASLLLAQDPSRRPEDIRQIINSTAEDLVGPDTEDIKGHDQYFGNGRINAYDALSFSTPKISFHAEAADETSIEMQEIEVFDEACTTVINSDFNNGFGVWNSGGKHVEISSKFGATVKLMNNSGVHSSIFTPTMDLRSQSSVSVDFTFVPFSMETGEDFMFEYSIDGGSTFKILKSWVSDIDFKHKKQQHESFVITNVDLTKSTVFRFRCDASSNTDMIYLDAVNITVCADASDICSAGAPCDDGNDCTVNDQYNSDCDCEGTYEDFDNDGICSAQDADDFDSCVPNGELCNDELDGQSSQVGHCKSFIYSDFESDQGVWTFGGNDAKLNNAKLISGFGSVHLRDNSKESSSIFTRAIDFSYAKQLSITFDYLGISMELGENFMLEVSTDGGKNFTIIKNWISGIDFKNSKLNMGEALIGQEYLSSEVILRLRCDASSNADAIYIDNIDIQVCGMDDLTTSFQSIIETTPEREVEIEDDLLTVYPNPTVDYISIKNINTPVPNFDVYIFTLDGTQVFYSQFSVDDELRIDVTSLHGATQYLVRVETAQSVKPITATFFKV